MKPSANDPLARYWAKRNFALTAEPRGETGTTAPGAASFVIQKHHASRLHYDLRLEIGGVLVSWAVPKGPSFDPAEKRIAVHVEDHPLSYAGFEGVIPPKQYGAGTVIVWDHGRWEPVAPTPDAAAAMHAGKLVFRLHGHKLFGLWELVRIAKPGDRQDAWMWFKKRDAWARPMREYDVISALPDSVISKPLKPAANALAGREDKGVGSGSIPSGAVRAPNPVSISPQLASLASAVPASGDWLWEIKLDGYRLMARIDSGHIRLFTRGGHDWSDKMPGLLEAIATLGLTNTWLDGEIVVLGANGTPEFNALQNAFDRSRTEAITYFLFDLPYFEGWDLRPVALASRRQLLQQLLADHPGERLRFSASFDADPAAILESARRMGLEGVIAKRRDARYESRRSESWLKLKNRQRQEFVVAGWSDRASGEAEVGSLLLAVHGAEGEEKGRLVYVGNVGTGWDASTGARLRAQLAAIEVGTSPFGKQPLRQHRWASKDRSAQHWVHPTLVVEVEFADWTPEAQVRHPKFIGLRTDRDPRSVVRESAIAPTGPALALTATRGTRGDHLVGDVLVSHPERVVDSSSGISKLELVRYYESVADWLLPHLRDRPCSLVRGPTGIGGELFFQKHPDTLGIPELRELPSSLWPGHAPLLEVATKKALVAAAQMNVIEFHTWNASCGAIDQPDRVVFDLDPGEGVPWERVIEGALLVRTLLQELALESWVKTSGGKGLHVVVPLTAGFGTETVRAFSQAAVQHLARVIPQRFVAKSGAANRVGRIFVDYLRNNHGATTASAFSARARPGLGVSMPTAWDLLPKLKASDQWTVRTAREHLSFQTVDPWEGYTARPQTLLQALERLGVKTAEPPPAVTRGPDAAPARTASSRPPRSRARSARA